MWRAQRCIWLNKTITIKGREAITKGERRKVWNSLPTLRISSLSLFSLSFQQKVSLFSIPDRLRHKSNFYPKKRKQKTWEERPTNFSSKYLCFFFFFFSVSSKFTLFFFFLVLKIYVCIYFLVGFNLWLFANTGLLG